MVARGPIASFEVRRTWLEELGGSGLAGSRSSAHISHVAARASIHKPHPQSPPPPIRRTHCVRGRVFSANTSKVRATIQSRFITPSTKSNAIRAQQQPKQYAP